MGLMALNVAALVLLQQPVLSAPSAVVTALGVLLLATGTALARRRDRTGADHDPVLRPLAGAGPTTTEPESSPAARRWGAVGVWIVPIWTAVLVAITWALAPGA
jgi:hypothetical protein